MRFGIASGTAEKFSNFTTHKSKSLDSGFFPTPSNEIQHSDHADLKTDMD